MTTSSASASCKRLARQFKMPYQKTSLSFYLKYLTTCVWFGSVLDSTTLTRRWRVCWPRSATRSSNAAVTRLIQRTCLVLMSKSASQTSMNALSAATNTEKSLRRCKGWYRTTVTEKTLTLERKTLSSPRTKLSSSVARISKKFARASFNSHLLKCQFLVVPRVKSGQ